MTAAQDAFSAFRRLVPTDPGLMARLRPIMERASFVEAVAACGAERGFAFGAPEVEAVLQANRGGWLSSWLPAF